MSLLLEVDYAKRARPARQPGLLPDKLITVAFPDLHSSVPHPDLAVLAAAQGMAQDVSAAGNSPTGQIPY